MIDPLIHLVTGLFSGFIQRGSVRGASIGAFFGILTAWTIAYLLWVSHIVEAWITLGIQTSLAGGFIGAMIGSRIPQRQAAIVFPNESVTAWRLNQALAPLAVVLFICGIAVVMAVAAATQAKDPIPRGWGWGILSASVLLLAVVSTRTTYGVQVGPVIRVLRLPRSKVYDRSRVRQWGFEIARGRLVHTPLNANVPLIIRFDDQSSVECEVSPATAQRIAMAFEKFEPDGPNDTVRSS